MQRDAVNTYPLGFALLAMISASAMAEDTELKPVSFIRQVAPILVGQCQACHGSKTAESNYRLDTFESLMRPGDFELPPITPGDLENSELHRLITAEDSHERMPNNGDRLANAEIEVITRWILQGAQFDGQNTAAPLRDEIPRDLPHPSAPETYPTALPVTAMAFTSDGKHLVTGGYHELLVFDPTSGTRVSRVGNIPQRTFAIAFSRDNSWLAIAGGSPGVSGEVRLIPWRGDTKSGEPKVFATQDDVFFDVAFRPDGGQLAASGADGAVRVFDVASGEERLKISNHADWVTDICFRPDGKQIATASRDKTAKVFDAESGALLATHSEHNAPVRAIAFAPDGKLVISAGGNRIRVWKVEDSALVGEMAGFENDIYALIASGDTVVGISADRSVRQFKLSDRTLVRSLTEHPESVLSLGWHESSHRISTGCFDGTVTIWNSEDGTMVKQFKAMPTVAQPTD